MKRFLIYGLRDPFTREIRYVGKSSSGLKRPRLHFAKSVLRMNKAYSGNWIRSLVRQKKLPEIVVLQQLDSATGLSAAEQYWIALGRSALGQRLTNMTDGGEGCTGRVVSEITRKKLSKSNQGKINWDAINKAAATNRRSWADPEYRAKMSSILRGLKRSAEVREGISKSSKRRWNDPEYRARVSAAIAAGKRKPEARERARQSSTGRSVSLETRSKIASSLRGRPRPLEVMERVAAKMRGKKASLDTRRKMSETHKRIWAERRAQRQGE